MALALFAAIAAPGQSPAQPRPAAALVAQAAAPAADTAGVEAFSDTTDTASAVVPAVSSYSVNVDADGLGHLIGDSLWMAGGVFGAFTVVVLLLVLAPLILIGIICYLIYKIRKHKSRLAGAVAVAGQTPPMDAAAQKLPPKEQEWRKGITNLSIGLGLFLLFKIIDLALGMGIGALVASIGAGQMVMARTSAGKKDKDKP